MDDAAVDVWFVVIPEEVYVFGRPQSRVPFSERQQLERRIDARIARRLRSQPSLFAEDMEEAKIYAYDLDFHNQLKARLLTFGEADIDQVCRDVLGLTKVNFNACIYGDGLPVTLRFADSVGEILTAGPVENLPPLPFRHYI